MKKAAFQTPFQFVLCIGHRRLRRPRVHHLIDLGLVS